MSTITPSDIARNPAWLAHGYDPIRDVVRFVEIDRARRGSAKFLTDACLPGLSPVSISRTAILATLPPSAPLHFIFHSAFCFPTVLADAFDMPGHATVLKEPMMLDDVVGLDHRGGGRGNAERLIGDACTLLARPFEPREEMLIVPSPLVNGFASALMRLRPNATALLLHAPMDAFLASVAEAGLQGRLWARRLFLSLARDGLLPFSYGHDEYFGQSDLQIATICWIAQQAIFADVQRRFGARVRTLNSDRVGTHPRETLLAVASFFGLPFNPETVDGIGVGPNSIRHLESHTDIGGDAHTTKAENAREVHADELHKVALWARTVADAQGIAMALRSPLLP